MKRGSKRQVPKMGFEQRTPLDDIWTAARREFWQRVAEERRRSPPPDGRLYRLMVQARPAGPWRKTIADAQADAIDMGAASLDKKAGLLFFDPIHWILSWPKDEPLSPELAYLEI